MIESQPRRPVTVSLSSANREFNHWVAENGYGRLKDARGLEWRLESRIDRLPHPERLHGTLFKHIIQLSLAINAESLLKSGIFSRPEDDRLLTLLGDAELPVKVEKLLHEADSLEKIRERFSEDVVKIREFLRKRDFSEGFRSMVGKYVSSRSLLTYRLTQGSQSKINLEF